jgi:hypothetical protein
LAIQPKLLQTKLNFAVSASIHAKQQLHLPPVKQMAWPSHPALSILFALKTLMKLTFIPQKFIPVVTFHSGEEMHFLLWHRIATSIH